MSFVRRHYLILFITLLLGLFVLIVQLSREESPVSVVVAPRVAPRRPASVASVANTPATAPPALTRANDNSPLPPLKAMSAPAPLTDESVLIPLIRPGRTTLNGRAKRWLGASAMLDTQYRPAMGPIVYKLNNFVLVALPADADALIFASNRRPAVFGAGNNRVEIISGGLSIKLKDLAAAPALANRFNLFFLNQDFSIGRAYYRMPDGFNLNSDLKRLAVDEDVEDVEVELLHGNARPR